MVHPLLKGYLSNCCKFCCDTYLFIPATEDEIDIDVEMDGDIDEDLEDLYDIEEDENDLKVGLITYGSFFFLLSLTIYLKLRTFINNLFRSWVSSLDAIFKRGGGPGGVNPNTFSFPPPPYKEI